MLAVQHQRAGACAARVTFIVARDARRLGIEHEIQSDLGDAIVRRAIVLEGDGARFFGAHGILVSIGRRYRRPRKPSKARKPPVPGLQLTKL